MLCPAADNKPFNYFLVLLDVRKSEHNTRPQDVQSLWCCGDQPEAAHGEAWRYAGVWEMWQNFWFCQKEDSRAHDCWTRQEFGLPLPILQQDTCFKNYFEYARLECSWWVCLDFHCLLFNPTFSKQWKTYVDFNCKFCESFKKLSHFGLKASCCWDQKYFHVISMTAKCSMGKSLMIIGYVRKKKIHIRNYLSIWNILYHFHTSTTMLGGNLTSAACASLNLESVIDV